MTLLPCGKGGLAGVAYGYKGKGILIYLLTDADGMPLAACSAPANEDERKHVGRLIETVFVQTGKAAQEREKAGGRYLISTNCVIPMYKKRNEAEQLFRRLKAFRRIFIRFGKLDVMFIGFIVFALIAIAIT